MLDDHRILVADWNILLPTYRNRSFRPSLRLRASCQAYHSSYIDEPSVNTIGNVAILPINTKVRGPAPISGMLGVPELADG